MPTVGNRQSRCFYWPVNNMHNPLHRGNFIEITVLFTGFIADTYGFGVYLFSTVIPDMKLTLGFSYTQAGVMISLAQVGFLLAALSSGMLTHRIGAKNLIVLSMLACTVSLWAMAFVTQTWQVGTLLVIAGAAAASVWVPMVAVAQDLIPSQHQGKAIGLMSSGTAYGVFVNGWAVPALLPEHGWQSVWLLVAILSTLLVVWGWTRLSRHHFAQPAVSDHAVPLDPLMPRPSMRELVRQPAAILVLAVMLLSGIACMPAQNFLMSYLRDDLGYAVETAGRALSLIGLVGMVGGFVMGALADKITVLRALALTYVLLGIATGLFLHHTSPYEVYLGAAIFGLAFNAIFGLVPAYISLNFPKSTAAMVFGMANVALGVGSMLGNYFGGAVYDWTQSFSLLYQVSTGVALLLVLLTVFLERLPKRT